MPNTGASWCNENQWVRLMPPSDTHPDEGRGQREASQNERSEHDHQSDGRNDEAKNFPHATGLIGVHDFLAVVDAKSGFAQLRANARDLCQVRGVEFLRGTLEPDLG